MHFLEHQLGDSDFQHLSSTTTLAPTAEDMKFSTRGTEEDAGSAEIRGTSGRGRAKEAGSSHVA